MRLALAVTLAAVLAAPRLAAAGTAAILVPPIELEVGRVTATTPDGPPIVSGEIMIGVSWASLFPHRTPIDVSIGLLTIGTTEAPRGGVLAREVDDDGDQTQGTFVAAELRLVEGAHWRTWGGGRAEWLHTDGRERMGGFARLSAEVWVGGYGGGSNALMMGTVALTGWVETGLRERLDHSRAKVFATGLGMRIPFLFASG